MLKKWNDLPVFMQNDEVWHYYQILRKKKLSLFIKRVMDVLLSSFLIILLFPFTLIIAIIIVIDSKGGVFYRQERVTTYGKVFKIHKFRTMVKDADKIGDLITSSNDVRITKIGKFLRKFRIDELPQLLDIFVGNMTFVGTRPEVIKYVKKYTPKMNATLLLPAGVTSLASIKYKDESELLKTASDVESTYLNEILPKKMEYNLKSIEEFSLLNDIKIMFKTVIEVIK